MGYVDFVCLWDRNSRFEDFEIWFLIILILCLLVFIILGCGQGRSHEFLHGGPIRTIKVEIDDDEYHRCMDSLYF